MTRIGVAGKQKASVLSSNGRRERAQCRARENVSVCGLRDNHSINDGKKKSRVDRIRHVSVIVKQSRTARAQVKALASVENGQQDVVQKSDSETFKGWRTLTPTLTEKEITEPVRKKKKESWAKISMSLSDTSSSTTKRQFNSENNTYFRLSPRNSRTLSIQRSLGPNSTINTVSLEKPMGVVFAPDTNGRIRVVEVVKDGKAEQLNNVARLRANGADIIRTGDVLRAMTTSVVTIDMARGSLTGDISSATVGVVLMDVSGKRDWMRARLAMRRYVA